MKLKVYEADLDNKLSEFDLWITPSLGEIKDTEQFQIELKKLELGFNTLAQISNNFADIKSCAGGNLAKNILPLINTLEISEAINVLISVIDVLYFATGKTDNSIKCQYPIYLCKVVGSKKIPSVSKNGGVSQKDIPRTYGALALATSIVSLSNHENEQLLLTSSFFQLLLSDKNCAKQLWSLGTSYVTLKLQDSTTSLLTPLVVSQSRGSITATQGHIPEILLRHYMVDWGMISGLDFNTQDVTLDVFFPDEEQKKEFKKRKYDFILPYLSRNDCKRLFIQCQFYAGDSGSVSHKVVDQTDSTRAITLKKYSLAVFMEYLDGAGYFSSLNGDLKKMITKESTYDFFQIKTAPIKLRRGLQEIQYLTVLEIEHAILSTSGNVEAVKETLLRDGYTSDEIEISLNNAIKYELIQIDENNLKIIEIRKQIVRCYCLLDCLANFGTPIPADKLNGHLLVPGYSIYWGMPQNDLIARTLEDIPNLKQEWEDITIAFNDIQWLLEQQFILSH